MKIYNRSKQKRYARTLGGQQLKDILNAQAEKALTKAVSMLSIHETRKEQIKMAQTILRFFNYAKTPGHSLLVEAGTGVGKSFAYLIPVCEHITQNPEKKAVIATNTISLQEQLTRKDCPVMGHLYNLKFEKAKGRNNYVCLKKLLDPEGNLFAPTTESEQIDMITKWLKTPAGKYGDKSDVDFELNYKAWRSVCSESFDCSGHLCPYKSDCYYNQARSRIQKANVIITTHAMVLTDFQTQTLPEYDVLILDEAHNFEKNATNALTITINWGRFYRLTTILRGKFCQSAFRHARILGKTEDWAKTMLTTADEFINNLPDGRVYSPGLKTDNIQNCLLQGQLLIQEALEKTTLAISQTALINLITEIDVLNNDIKTWTEHGLKEAVYWVEKKEAKYVPINIGNWLSPLWEEKTTLLTSATLCVDKQFDTIKNSLNLNSKTYTMQLNSPFNYQENGLIYCPPKAPSPKSSKYEDYVVSITKTILEKSMGKTFILFTSYSMLQATAAQLRQIFGNKFLYLVQGEDTRERLLKQYRTHDNAVLLGTDSFWEGVDEDIDCVILTKLPFAVPTIPIEEAHYEAIKASGQNPFMVRALPECALKLKQGTGRLIRHQQKRGLVVICDPRIKTGWGKIIRRTLPPMKWTEDIELISNYLPC